MRLEIEVVRTREQEWQALADDRDAEARVNEEENWRLRAQNLVLSDELKSLRKTRGQAAIPIPGSYDELPRWVDAYFADRLFLHSRAVRALEDAAFENIALVYETIKLLAEAYWPLRVNEDPVQRQILAASWESGMKRLGLDHNSQSIAENRLGEFRRTYTINYRIGQSSRQVLGPT